MKVFVAGSTGAVGRVLVPHLLELGHEVVGLARDPTAFIVDLVRKRKLPIVGDGGGV